LVVSHEASRTGAPRIAIEVIQALEESQWDRRVVLRWPGPLRAAFAATGAKVVTEPLRRLRVQLRRWSPTRPLANHLEQLSAALVIRWQRPDVIWCNTVLSACYVKPGLRRGLGVVLHAHESREWMAQVLKRYNLDEQWQKTVLVGCAQRVCSDLADLTGRPPTDVVCLPSVPDRSRILELARRGGGQPLPAAGVIVGACGSASDAKGVDLWLEMVARIAPEIADLDPRFVWIGADPPAEFAEWAATHDPSQRVTFTGSLENPYRWLAALDVFTLTSRVDQFPLVVLEAMLLGRPVVAFAVGDVPRQIGDAGRLVPPLDVGRAGDAVINLLRDPKEQSRLGGAAAARAHEHFPVADFAVAVRQIGADASLLASRDRDRATR
jgi:glycosyltransferase involved in cell wall biosynthesis